MAEGGAKRNPSTHRTAAQTVRHRKTYQSTPKQKEIARERANLRYAGEKAGIVHPHDGKDLAHKKPIKGGGGYSLKEVTVQSQRENRGHGMTDGKKANMNKKKR